MSGDRPPHRRRSGAFLAARSCVPPTLASEPLLCGPAVSLPSPDRCRRCHRPPPTPGAVVTAAPGATAPQQRPPRDCCGPASRSASRRRAIASANRHTARRRSGPGARGRCARCPGDAGAGGRSVNYNPCPRCCGPGAFGAAHGRPGAARGSRRVPARAARARGAARASARRRGPAHARRRRGAASSYARRDRARAPRPDGVLVGAHDRRVAADRPRESPGGS